MTPTNLLYYMVIVCLQAADILSPALAMLNRYLEDIKSRVKSTNSKVNFLPAANQTVQQQMTATSLGCRLQQKEEH